MELTKEQKQDLIQQAARKAWKDGGEWGLLAMCTGSGKTKVAIDIVSELVHGSKAETNILLAVPGVPLRDKNWKAEFEKWQRPNEYEILKRSTYISLDNYHGEVFDLVILDEGHKITPQNSSFFTNNSIRRLLVLSATPPIKPDAKEKAQNTTEAQKYALFIQYRIKTDFYYPIEQAQKDGLAPMAEIYIVETSLDNTVKYIEAGTKAARFMQTEQQKYEFLSKQIKSLMIGKKMDVVKFKSMERRRLIASSISKKAVIKLLINKYAPGNRTLVFGGSIAMIDELLPGKGYHSKAGKAAQQIMEDFQNLVLDIMGCVDGVNEGMNFESLDMGIIGQVSSNTRELVQRIGRFRWRKDHVPTIFIVVCTNTQDDEWLKSALIGLGSILVKYIHAKNL